MTQPSRYDADGAACRADGAAHPRSRLSRASRSTTRQPFIVVTNNYRANGGGNFPGCDGSTVVLEAPDANRDAMVRYIVETRHVEPKADGNWRFAPWPAHVVATFLTSPAAADATPPSASSSRRWATRRAASRNTGSSRYNARRKPTRLRLYFTRIVKVRLMSPLVRKARTVSVSVPLKPGAGR